MFVYPVSNGGENPAAFPATRWSVVQRMRGGDELATREAIDEFCSSYWYPLYAYARRRGKSPEDSQDLTQGFFAQLLERGALERIDREAGRVRSFLLGSMENFVNQAHRNATAQKRGGGAKLLPLDFSGAEGRYLAEPAAMEGEGIADQFDREWANALIARCLSRMRAFYEEGSKVEVFEALKGSLMGDGDYSSDPGLGERLGLGADGVRGAVFRMRKRFRRYIEDEVRETVSDPAELDDEFAHLCRVLAMS